MKNNIEEMDTYDFSIDASDTPKLLERLQEAPEVYWEHAKQLESAKKLVADYKLKIRVKESEIGDKLRKETAKVSEARIEKSYFGDLDYVRLNQELNAAKSIEGKLSAFVRALEQRQSIMLSMLHYIRQELRQQVI